ncbi:MAG: hypothetical protein AB1555_02645 [Nitrospirota bacterium]
MENTAGAKVLSPAHEPQPKFAVTVNRTNTFLFTACLFLAGADSGCSFLQWPAEEEKLDANQAYWFHYEASRRGGFLVMADNSTSGPKVKMCAEPPPDVALSRTADLVAKVAYQGASGELQGKLAEQLAQLAGRSENVLILRESLFRLCELSINSGLSPQELQNLYTTVINAIVALTTTEATRARTELSKAQTERMMIFQTLPEQYKQQFAPP